MVIENKMPFGAPPILPDVKDQLKEYLLHPDRLPIHDYERCQLFWPREPDINDLFFYENSPLATALKVQRHPFTGKIIEFREVNVDEVGLTPKNSTSLNRAPGPLSEQTRGSSSNYPFWPGGFPDPILDLPPAEEIDLSKELLSIPPGFSRGLQFREDGCTLVTDSPPVSVSHQSETEESLELSVVNLLSVVQEENNLIGLWSDNDDSIKNSSTKPINLLSDFNIDDNSVIPEESTIPVLNITGTSSKSVTRHSQWAEMIDINKPVTDFEKKIPEMAHKFNFELDTFQKQAILKLEEHSNVFVAAHTSAGKTVVAEYAIALSQQHMTRTIYTSPIKALSNQKYRDFKNTFKDVGLITGDFQINETGSCLIMTTEILRSMLYCGSDVTRDLEYVIFDEVHYINDADRGHVWEEVLILLPDHVTIVMLSATVPNTFEFASWVGRTKQRKVYVISTPKRPVPLVHYLYTGCGGSTKNDRFMIVDENGKFSKTGYDAAVAARATKSSNKSGNKHHYSQNQEQTMWVGLIDHLRRCDKLPLVAFTLSRKRCDLNADALTSIDLNDATEKHRVHQFFNKCIKRLKPEDQKLPQVLKLQACLEKGIGVHHSGILPILKEIVEMLFQNGLVKILFATETFAMGVNMPTKTVLFDAVCKYDGKQVRDLWPAEYIQMAGRAGRRGHDDEGTVIIICKANVPGMEQLKAMMLGKPEKLQSQFRLTYGMLLNLLRVESLTVERMLSHSFREVEHRTRADILKKELENTEKQLENLPKCFAEHLQKLAFYYDAASDYFEHRKSIWPNILQKFALKELAPGRILLINSEHHINKLALLLNVQNKKDTHTYSVLVLNHQKMPENDDIELITKNNSVQEPNKNLKTVDTSQDEYYKMLSYASELIFQQDGVGGHEVITITSNDISQIVAKVIKIDTDLVIKDWEKRQIERFRSDPIGKTCNEAIQELTKLTRNSKTKSSINFLNVINDLKIKDLDIIMKWDQLTQFEKKLNKVIEFTKIASFEKQFDEVFRKKHLESKRRNLEYCISHESMSLYPEYESRIKTLMELDYIDSQRRSIEFEFERKIEIKLKGKVACQIGTNELILTELVLRNVLTNLRAEEVAALLSCLVFQAKTDIAPNLTKTLQEGMQAIEKIQADIKAVEKKYAISDDDALVNEELNFGLVEVVYDWAMQEPFGKIMEKTDIQEGIIVRCIQQLNETLNDVKDAAVIIGDPKLLTKMEEASNCVKRDIVFAASLYTQDDNTIKV